MVVGRLLFFWGGLLLGANYVDAMLILGRVLGNSGELFGVTLSKVVGDLPVQESKGHALNHLVHVYSLLVDDGCKTRCHTPTFFLQASDGSDSEGTQILSVNIGSSSCIFFE